MADQLTTGSFRVDVRSIGASLLQTNLFRSCKYRCTSLAQLVWASSSWKAWSQQETNLLFSLVWQRKWAKSMSWEHFLGSAVFWLPLVPVESVNQYFNVNLLLTKIPAKAKTRSVSSAQWKWPALHAASLPLSDYSPCPNTASRPTEPLDFKAKMLSSLWDGGYFQDWVSSGLHDSQFCKTQKNWWEHTIQ